MTRRASRAGVVQATMVASVNVMQRSMINAERFPEQRIRVTLRVSDVLSHSRPGEREFPLPMGTLSEHCASKPQLTRDGRGGVCNVRVAPFTDIFTFHRDSAARRVISGGTKKARRKYSERKDEERKQGARER